MEKEDTFETYFDQEYEASFPDEFLEAYEIIECLSAAEACDTLLVTQKGTGKKIVAKCYRAGSLMSGHEGKEPFGSVECDAVPEFVGEYRNEKYRCILREYIEGVPLNEFVMENYMTEEIILDIAIELAELMKSFHSLQPPVIHRDIKPENIIVKEDGSLALIDFGISRVYKENGTSDTVFCGTEDFAPPEQYGFMQTDIRSDIYSFGVVLSWLITGKAKPMKKPLTKLERVATKCCAFSPNRRYKNDGALLKDLHRLTRQHVRRVRRQMKIAAAVLALVVAAGAIGGACYLKSVRDQAVVFEEPMIEEAVRTMLDKPEGILTKEDLEQMTGIYIMADSVCETQDDYYEISDQWYSSEERIHGPIESLEDLRNMPNLRIVCIEAQQITDLSPMEDLDNLEKISMSNNSFSDISPLAGKEFLKEVYIIDTILNGIDAVATWPRINALGLSNTGAYDGSPIGELDDLEYLDIKNDSDAYKYLKGKRFTELSIGAFGQRDVECIRDVEYVQRLYIRWSDIEDISALEGREDIVFINMEDCAIEDLSPLFTMPNLCTVEMNSVRQKDMEKLIEIYGEPGFEITYL
ncbi:MAG: protein kinase [Agathobacter sp.]